ncbi:MAG TPA: PAS domain-containing protein [Acidobacteriaceae bacterium]|nr:PAS domain-containing protein [Acidobacteriaceae bacterium]
MKSDQSASSASSLGSTPSLSSRILGAGEMADRVRAFDWAATSLGPIASWSKELVTIVNLTLCSPSPARTMWGPEFILIYNDHYRSFPGPRHPAALGRPARETYEESWPVVGPLLEHAYATGEVFFYEKLLVPLPGPNGMEDHYLNYSFNPIYEDGKLAGLFGPLHDVTGEVIAHRRLRESEARATRILHSIGDAVIVTDAEARITRMNPIAEQLTGWTEDSALGLPLDKVFRIVAEETHEIVESPVAKVKRTGAPVSLANHTILIRRDGTEISIDDSGAPIFADNGTLNGIVLIFRDISTQRTMEQQREHLLRELRSRYAELEATYNNAAIAMAIIDAKDFRYTRVNDRLCSLLGMPPEEVIGSKVTDIAADVPGLIDSLKRAAAGIAVTGGILQGELTTTPGVTRYWTMDYMPIFNPQGQVVAIAAASAEITQLKRAEAALMQSEKLAAVGRLASSIAHEINNPLEAVTNLLYLARISKPSPEVQQYLTLAERELQRVSVIANQTLRFHKQSTRPTDIACEDLFREVVNIYQGRLVNSNIDVQIRSRARCTMCCYEGEIRQVLSNLLANAIDAMGAKGGRILLRSREVVFRPEPNAAPIQGIAITLADEGPGMPPEIAAQIFQAFFTTKGFAGTGLGLWISQEIVQRHGGTLTVRTSQREGSSGTVFTLRLPLAATTR